MELCQGGVVDVRLTRDTPYSIYNDDVISTLRAID